MSRLSTRILRRVARPTDMGPLVQYADHPLGSYIDRNPGAALNCPIALEEQDLLGRWVVVMSFPGYEEALRAAHHIRRATQLATYRLRDRRTNDIIMADIL